MCECSSSSPSEASSASSRQLCDLLSRVFAEATVAPDFRSRTSKEEEEEKPVRKGKKSSRSDCEEEGFSFPDLSAPRALTSRGEDITG